MGLLTTIFSLRRSWPPRPIDLLLRACVLPEAEARAAWQAWTRERVFDDMTWPEIRLVAYLSGRIATLDPQSPLRPRVEGLGRAHWTRNQAKLRGLVEIHDALARNGIDAMVFKGAAVHVEGIGALRRRVLGDVDILVRPGDISGALEVTIGQGWRCVTGESPELLRVLTPRLRGLNFRKDAHAEIDLHQYVFKWAPPGTQEGTLWADARHGTALGQSIAVPSPAHSLVIGLNHGSATTGGDWALDAVARLATPGLDWEGVVAAARHYAAVSNVHAGLLYLRERLGQSVPAGVLETLARVPDATAHRLDFWVNGRQGPRRTFVERALGRLVHVRFKSSGYRLEPRYDSVVQVMRANPVWRWAPRRQVCESRERALAREFALPAGRHTRMILVLAFAAPQSSRRLFFDISIDGRGIARARTRAGGSGDRAECVRYFAVRLPHERVGPGRVKIESRPVTFESPLLDDAARALIEPIPFSVRSVGLMPT